MMSQIAREYPQRIGALAALPNLLRGFGEAPSDVLAQVGLSPETLDNPETTIPYEVMGHLLTAAVDQTRCPHLGLLLGQQITTRSLGLIGELMRNAPTLGTALEDFVAYQHQNSRGSVVYLLKDDQQVYFGYAVYQPEVTGNDVICDTAASAAVNIVRELAGSMHLSSISVHLCRPEPDDSSRYCDLLGKHLRFSGAQTALLLPQRLLEHPIIGAKSHLRVLLEKRVSMLGSAHDLKTVERLRRAIRVGLIRGDVSADSMALELGLGRRTLDRQLRRFGVRFQEVLDETRCHFTQQLLAQTRLEIGEIAGIIGYGNPSVLTRAFIRWTGQSPREWRSALEPR